MVRPRILLTCLLLLAPFSHSREIDFQEFENSSVLRLMVNGLKSLLNNCIVGHVIVDYNMILGLAMASAQLQVTLDNMPDGVLHPLYFELNQMRKRCLDLKEETPDMTQTSVKHIKRSDIWEIDKPSRNLNYDGDGAAKNLKQNLAERLLDWTMPSPNMSSYCTGSLFDSCIIPEECIRAETTDDNTGYELTHQILFWQVFRQMNCSDYNKWANADGIIEHKCGRVLQETYYVTFLNTNDPIYQDLFLEQVVLCGIENFQQFLTMDIKKTILSLQTSQGCLLPQLDPLESKDNMALVTHIHALATAVLSIQIKDLINSKGVW